MIIKSVDALSAGKVMACLYGLLGVIVGLFFTLAAILGAAIGEGQGGPIAVLFGLGASFFVPVFYGVIGFLGGVISAFLYNLAAAIVGGIEIELKKTRA